MNEIPPLDKKGQLGDRRLRYPDMKSLKESTGMKRSRKPWSTKLRPDMKPEVVVDPRVGDALLLPAPNLIAAEITTVPRGSLITVSELRNRLARRFKADRTCPLMTGIFFNIIAGAAEEQVAAGQQPLAPYWRVILDNGTLSPKTPAGPERQAEWLREEGHRVEVARAKLKVDGFQQRLAL